MDFQSPFSLISLALFIFFLVKLFTSSKSKSKQNLLPEPWRLPIIGHMHHLIGTMPHRGVRDLARKYGSLMHLQLGEVSTIVVSSPRWAKEVLTTHDITFANRPETLTGEIVAYHNTDIVLAPYGEYWRQLRKLCTLELLSAKKVKSFQSLREEECWNLSENIFKMIATILSRAAFGKGIKDQREFTEIVKEILRLTGGFDVADIFPSKKLLHHLSGKRAKLTKIHNKLDNLISDIMSQHPESRSTSNEILLDVLLRLKDSAEFPLTSDNIKAVILDNCFIIFRERYIMSEHPGSRGSTSNETLLDVLLRLKESDEFPLTADNVKAIILDMFGAGTDTSSATIEWAISELLRNPRAMEKAQAELRQALKGKERIQEEDIQDLSYLKLVIKETLRLHPPLPLVMPRECRKPCNLGGYDISEKTKLIVNVFAINRDPEYWKDAKSFIPERFENSSINIMGAEYEYLPFGAGRRMCPGAALGLANVELPLAHILSYFNWKLQNEVRSEDLDMNESFGATVQRKTELLLVPTSYSSMNDSS